MYLVFSSCSTKPNRVPLTPSTLQIVFTFKRATKATSTPCGSGHPVVGLPPEYFMDFIGSSSVTLKRSGKFAFCLRTRLAGIVSDIGLGTLLLQIALSKITGNIQCLFDPPYK